MKRLLCAMTIALASNLLAADAPDPARYGLAPARPKSLTKAVAQTNRESLSFTSLARFRQLHGTNVAVPLEVFHYELNRAITRRSQAADRVERASRDEREFKQQVAVKTVDLGGPNELLKYMAGKQAQALGTPRFAMGDLRWYAAPTVDDYCRGDPEWQAADRDVSHWQQLIIARHQADAAKDREHRRKQRLEDPKHVAAIVSFLQEQAQQGSSRAKFELGQRLVEGRGVDLDPVKGMAFIQQAASEGHADATAFLDGLNTVTTNSSPAPAQSASSP